MKTSSRILRVKTHNQPFNLFDIDRENIVFTVGNTTKDENIFVGTEKLNYLNLMCEIVPKKDFSTKINISSRYQKMVGVTDSISELKRSIYGTVPNGFVSSIDIIFKNSTGEELPSEWREFLQNNEKIYTKDFLVQKEDLQVDMTEDPRHKSNMYHHMVSKAYPFAGMYHRGIPIDKIEQHFFYVGTELQAKEYMNTISSRELLSGGFLNIAPGVRASNITSLKDDIVSGSVIINMPDETKYQSVDIKKDTVISNICSIIFKRI